MNPHTEHPDDGSAPAGGTAGQSAGQSLGPSAAPVPDQTTGQPGASSAGMSAETTATAPVDMSATLPLDFAAGAGAGTPPPPPYLGPAPGPTPGPTPPPAGSQPENFFDWIRRQGIRRGRERWVGGVASGIAERFGVDPLIVRGILIVLTVFAGVGVVLYGIAWALLPEPDGRIHVQEAAAGRWSSGMTGALITTVIGFPSLGTGFWGWDRYGAGPFIWTVFWVGGVIYLIYYLTQRNKSRNEGTPKTATPQTDPYTAADYSGTTPADYSGTPFPGYGGPPASAAGWGTPPPSTPAPPPGGGYRPDPGGASIPPVKPRNPGPGSPAVAVTVGLALLVGGGLKALDAANVIDLGTSSNAIVWASGAVILGLGILVSGLRCRTSGILGFFAAVALIVGGIFNVLPNGDRFRPQNADWYPASIDQARGGFDITAGTGTVDLTRLALNPPLGTDLVVPIDATASNLTVVIPDTVPVEVRADITMGNLNEGSQSHGGMTSQQRTYNTGKPGATLILTIDGTFSNVTIKEGN
ncbi:MULTISPECIES: PspC domain-containing protein [unclassified Arthrobacter]|uniref:PspC domain-containing protein n=1 Tax=unclassified Arthrobacter TaxID=235627 RepID=UPI002E016191|nr:MULTISPECIES: PspC domain-containing protein [unclassified Arthrobacter]MEC5190098.1 phage shock protein PspC (stress-responsive transcriptional regulator) [Arthrobacter sp. MP_M4]MEC5201566.1 phage shock protein PspC (stress-responsive transcriptional regulator) [Arthrobacter sp. MP_M7]